MTEAEWLSSTNPSPMITFVRDKVSERKLRLFACSCCRKVWNSLGHPLLRKAVEVAERYADGLANERELEAMRDAVCPGPYFTGTLAASAAFGTVVRGTGLPVWAIDAATELACAEAVREALSQGQTHLHLETKRLVRQSQADLMRCIVGPLPFRTIAFDENVLTTTRVVDLARTIYDERSFQDLAILAHALQDAGCSDADILEHCCHPGEHDRGCWVVDRILSKG